MNSSARLSAFIDHNFDHREDAPEWPGPREEIPTLIAEMFEHSGELLARFSDEQLNQGFWFLMGNSPIDLALTAPVFEQVMAVRCTPHLGHLEEKGASPLNSACYMWWDLMRFHGLEQASRSLDAESTFRRLFSIPHDACRESALHGVGHWIKDNPQLAAVVDEFLSSTPNLRPELAVYAEHAKMGRVL